MEITNLTILSISFTTFLFALLIENDLIKRIKIGSIFEIEPSIESTRKKTFKILLFILSISLYIYTFFISVVSSRDIYFFTLIFGVALLILKVLTSISTSFGFAGIIIESKETEKLKINSNLIKASIIVISFSLTLYLFDMKLNSDFNNYEKRVTNQIIDETMKADFISKYLPKELKIENNIISEKELVKLVSCSNNINYFIKGRAGIGKSWFLKNFIKNLKKTSEKYVLKIKARNLDTAITINEYLNKTIFGQYSWFTQPIINNKILKSILIIDGLDELDFSNRERLVNEIRRFKKESSNTNIIITSRPIISANISNDFKIASINHLSKKQVDKISKNRLIKKFNHYLKEKKDLIISFNNGIDSIPINQLNDNRIYTEYKKFLSENKLNISNTTYYYLKPTFRDLDILEDLFFENLFYSRVDNQIKLNRFGKTKIFETWIKKKIKTNSTKLENKLGINYGDSIYNLVISELESIYLKNSNITSFNILITDLEHLYNDKYVKDIFMLTDLFIEDNNKITFRNHSIDEYFISMILKKRIDNNPKDINNILSKYSYYEQTEILPFLIGQYKNAKPILDILIKKDIYKGDIDYKISLYLGHLNKTEENIKYLRDDLLNSEISSRTKDILNDYLNNF